MVGDRVTLTSGDKGVVEHIGIRTSHIRALGEGELLIVPNVELANSRIRNRSRCDHRRLELTLEIDSATPPAKLALVKAALERAVREVPYILRLEGVGLASVGGRFGGYVFEIVFFITSGETQHMRVARHDFFLNAVISLSELGIKFQKPVLGSSPVVAGGVVAAEDGLGDVSSPNQTEYLESTINSSF